MAGGTDSIITMVIAGGLAAFHIFTQLWGERPPTNTRKRTHKRLKAFLIAARQALQIRREALARPVVPAHDPAPRVPFSAGHEAPLIRRFCACGKARDTTEFPPQIRGARENDHVRSDQDRR